MNQEELNKILEEHEKWLINPEEGKRADFRKADLGGADFYEANLEKINFDYAYLRSVNFGYANLRNTSLRYTDLSYAYLRNADLRGANLKGANLKGASLDYSAFPLWCGSFDMVIDDSLVNQLIYHIFKLQGKGKNLEKIKKTKWLKDIANQFHRADECEKIE